MMGFAPVGQFCAAGAFSVLVVHGLHRLVVPWSVGLRDIFLIVIHVTLLDEHFHLFHGGRLSVMDSTCMLML